MNILRLLAKAVFGLIVIIIVLVGGYLFIAPPDLLRIAANYSAKIVCSNVFLAGRAAHNVLNVDVQAGGHPSLRYIHIDVDEPNGVVTARFLGLFATGTAVYRPGLGCSSAPDNNIDRVKAIQISNEKIANSFVASPWQMAPHIAKLDDVLADDALLGPAMRAVVVIKNGQLIGETYGPGFNENTPLIGWSMSKTVTALITGMVLSEKLQLNSDALFEVWQDDARKNIKLSDLLSMSSGLSWNEGYGSVSDVTRMLYAETDMPAFAAAQPLEIPTNAARFHYSTGTTILLSRIWQDAVGDDALIWPHDELFGPLGMGSAVFETDARGTYTGGSYLYASARDWARLGQLVLDRGQWQGKQLIDADYIDWMSEGNPKSMAGWGKPEYGNGQIWLHGPRAGTPRGQDPDAAYNFGQDIRWFLGHDGQSMAVIPSQGLIVVRMGLTPSHHKYKPQALVAAIMDAVN